MFNRNSRQKAESLIPATPGALVLSIDSSTRGLEFLIDLVNRIRPDRPVDFKQAELKFGALLYTLQQDRSMLFSLRRSLLTQFLNTDIVVAMTESRITSSRGFVQELSSKLQHKILPALQKKNDFLFVLNMSTVTAFFSNQTDRRCNNNSFLLRATSTVDPSLISK